MAAGRWLREDGGYTEGKRAMSLEGDADAMFYAAAVSDSDDEDEAAGACGTGPRVGGPSLAAVKRVRDGGSRRRSWPARQAKRSRIEEFMERSGDEVVAKGSSVTDVMTRIAGTLGGDIAAPQFDLMSHPSLRCNCLEARVAFACASHRRLGSASPARTVSRLGSLCRRIWSFLRVHVVFATGGLDGENRPLRSIEALVLDPSFPAAWFVCGRTPAASLVAGRSVRSVTAVVQPMDSVVAVAHGRPLLVIVETEGTTVSCTCVVLGTNRQLEMPSCTMSVDSEGSQLTVAVACKKLVVCTDRNVYMFDLDSWEWEFDCLSPERNCQILPPTSKWLSKILFLRERALSDTSQVFVFDLFTRAFLVPEIEVKLPLPALHRETEWEFRDPNRSEGQSTWEFLNRATRRGGTAAGDEIDAKDTEIGTALTDDGDLDGDIADLLADAASAATISDAFPLSQQVHKLMTGSQSRLENAVAEELGAAGTACVRAAAGSRTGRSGQVQLERSASPENHILSAAPTTTTTASMWRASALAGRMWTFCCVSGSGNMAWSWGPQARVRGTIAHGRLCWDAGLVLVDARCRSGSVDRVLPGPPSVYSRMLASVAAMSLGTP